MLLRAYVVKYSRHPYAPGYSQSSFRPGFTPENFASSLLMSIIEHFTVTTDCAVCTQAAKVLSRVLFAGTQVAELFTDTEATRKAVRGRHIVQVAFLPRFYKFYMQWLVQPLCAGAAQSAEQSAELSSEQSAAQSARLTVLCELMASCVEQHGAVMREYVCSTMLGTTVLQLLQHSSDTVQVRSYSEPLPIACATVDNLAVSSGASIVQLSVASQC
jgi:hypothetical protein